MDTLNVQNSGEIATDIKKSAIVEWANEQREGCVVASFWGVD